jgi:hypothetical protein
LDESGSLSVKRRPQWERVVPTADLARIDATSDEEIAAQQAEDDAEAARDSASRARRVRRRTGFSQIEFARRIGVTTTNRSRLGAPRGAAWAGWYAAPAHRSCAGSGDGRVGSLSGSQSK